MLSDRKIDRPAVIRRIISRLLAMFFSHCQPLHIYLPCSPFLERNRFFVQHCSVALYNSDARVSGLAPRYRRTLIVLSQFSGSNDTIKSFQFVILFFSLSLFSCFHFILFFVFLSLFFNLLVYFPILLYLYLFVSYFSLYLFLVSTRVFRHISVKLLVNVYSSIVLRGRNKGKMKKFFRLRFIIIILCSIILFLCYNGK